METSFQRVLPFSVTSISNLQNINIKNIPYGWNLDIRFYGKIYNVNITTVKGP